MTEPIDRLDVEISQLEAAKEAVALLANGPDSTVRMEDFATQIRVLKSLRDRLIGGALQERFGSNGGYAGTDYRFEGKAADKAVAQLNRDWPIGTMVRYWPGTRADEPRVGKIRSIWWKLGSGAVVVKVTGYAGAIWSKHVQPLTREEIARLSCAK